MLFELNPLRLLLAQGTRHISPCEFQNIFTLYNKGFQYEIITVNCNRFLLPYSSISLNLVSHVGWYGFTYVYLPVHIPWTKVLWAPKASKGSCIVRKAKLCEVNSLLSGQRLSRLRSAFVECNRTRSRTNEIRSRDIEEYGSRKW